MPKTWLKSLLMLTLAVAAACPQTAHSQTVDVPGALVVYFDEAATVRSWYGTGPVTAYIIAGPLDRWTGTAYVPYQQIEAWSGTIALAPQVGHATATVVPRGGAAPAVIELADGTTDWFAMLTYGPDGPMDRTCIVAGINTAAPVAVVQDSWGAVKAMFR